MDREWRVPTDRTLSDSGTKSFGEDDSVLTADCCWPRTAASWSHMHDALIMKKIICGASSAPS